MKRSCFTLFTVFLFSQLLFAQKNATTLLLRNGVLTMEPGMRQSWIDSFNTRAPRFNNKALVLLQFETLPSETTRKLLAARHISLEQYLSSNTYLVAVQGNIDLSALLQCGAKAVLNLQPEQKMDADLSAGIIAPRMVKVQGTVDVSVYFPSAFTPAEVRAFLEEKNIDIIDDAWGAYGKLSLRIATNRLRELASFPFVSCVLPVAKEDQPLNENSRTESRANILNNPVASGGRGLDGTGVCMGVGDNANTQFETDFTGRLINHNTLTGSHGIHVTGTAGGAGIINERYKGYAPGSTLVSEFQSRVLANAGLYAQDFNMVLTNNSYGPGPDCKYNGTYTAPELDRQGFIYPHLLHVFAAGNNGTDLCPPYAQGFGTVLGGWQASKNILTVGAVTDSTLLTAFSVRGPVKDGRIKPEVVAMGQLVVSNWPNNIYVTNNGTSMAAPAVTGGLALLYQRYRQLNAGADPQGALMNALLCNGATDKGNPGPDYSYGFGLINLLRSVEMLEQHRYFQDKSVQGSVKTHSITVPYNSAQLKIMLYWHDPEASPLKVQALVNDLDLEVVDPSGNVVLPKLLDTVNTNVNLPAANGADHINNIEQVVIDQPVAGNYTIRVRGTAIAMNPQQEYVVVYDALPVSVRLTFPAGGEYLVPGESEKISWDAYGNSTGTFTIQFSTDDGSTWQDIVNDLPADRRLYTWQVPAAVTDKARVRVVQNGTGLTSMGQRCTILGVPVVSLSPAQCESYISINWNAVAGADDYEILRLKGTSMQPVGTTTSTSFNLDGLEPDSLYWVGVRARVNGVAGRRSVAVSRKPDNGNCAGTVSDNDLELSAILSPVNGRKFTSGELKPDQVITVQVKNLDDAPANQFTLAYSLDGGPWITEHVTATIAPGSVYTYSFAARADLSALRSYRLAVVVKNDAPDASVSNDTMITTVRHLANDPIRLDLPFTDNFEGADSATYTYDTVGLAGIERYDFENSLETGQLKTFLYSDIPYSGRRSLFLAEERPQSNPRGVNKVT
jgi:hypothetical protein